ASEEPIPPTPEIVSDVVEDVPQAPDDITEETAVEADVTPEVVEPEFTYTYHRDVKPIFETLCVNCHQPGAIRASSPLTTYEESLPWLDAIQHQVATRKMPPWPGDPTCADYKHKEYLTPDEIERVVTWVDEGAPEGDPDAEPNPMHDILFANLSREDLVISMPLEYTPQTSPDDYRCFLIPWPLEETTYITGFGARPGNTDVVHHAIAFLIEPSVLPKFQAWDEADPGPGYSCFGGPSGPGAENSIQNGTWFLSAWTPGSPGADSPVGTGMKVEPGSYISLQIHYNTYFSDPEPDLTEVMFKLDDTVENPGWAQPWTNPDWIDGNPFAGLPPMTIPAGESDAVFSFVKDPWTLPPFLSPFPGKKLVLLYHAALHMHYLGTSGRVFIERADGTETCLLSIAEYDFDWQRIYPFQDGIELRPGDKLGVECHFDNSAENQPLVDGVPKEPVDVTWGEGSTNEMCWAVMYLVALDEDPAATD
ncbi:MAG: hypothetical protein VX938_05945, partial [Myxococcota bacterium]|nr:hypothetical protein [Myxococcota bacterium]